MRKLICLVVVAACGGPSSQEIKSAKSAEYKASVGQAFDAALQETQIDYKIDDVDPANGRFATRPQFYTPEGMRLSGGADGVVQNVNDHTKIMHLVVHVKRLPEDRVTVVVTPRTFEVISGSPKPRELAPDDPSLPPWVKGRVDNLAVRIHERLRPMMVPPGGGAAPAPEAAPQAAAPAPEPPPAGSAAPQAP